MTQPINRPIGASFFRPESEAIKALTDPENSLRELLGYDVSFVPVEIDEYRNDGSSFLDGYILVEGEGHYTQLGISFPRFYEQSLARLRRQEPRATIDLTIE